MKATKTMGTRRFELRSHVARRWMACLALLFPLALAQDAQDAKATVRAMLEALDGQPKTEALLRQHATSEAFIAHVLGSEAAFPRYRIGIDEMIAEGDLVAARLTLEGTHEGAFAGLAPTGNAVRFSGMAFYRVEEGKVADFWLQADQASLMQQLAASEGTAMSPAAIGERFVAIFNENDPAIADVIFAPDFSARVSGAPTPTLDREGWKDYLASIRSTFPDLRLDVQDVFTTDDTVTLRVILRGTQTGAFGDMPPSGKEVAFDGIAIHRVANGQVVEHWGVMDLLSLVQQLETP